MKKRDSSKPKWRDLPEAERRRREAAAHSSLFGVAAILKAHGRKVTVIDATTDPRVVEDEVLRVRQEAQEGNAERSDAPQGLPTGGSSGCAGGGCESGKEDP